MPDPGGCARAADGEDSNTDQSGGCQTPATTRRSEKKDEENMKRFVRGFALPLFLAVVVVSLVPACPTASEGEGEGE